MGKRRIAVSRKPSFAGTAPFGPMLVTSSTTLVHVSRELADTPPTTIPPRPRTVGPRLTPAKLGEYTFVPRRRA
jgi:hypothetical protein